MGSTATVLVVDDDATLTNIFAKALRLEGYQVRTAVDAEGGLRQAEESQPNAIILDLRMPLIDGLGFLHRLRARDGHRHTPVAIVTADYWLDDTVATQLRALGAVVRFKPLWIEDLISLTRSLLEMSH